MRDYYPGFGPYLMQPFMFPHSFWANPAFTLGYGAYASASSAAHYAGYGSLNFFDRGFGVANEAVEQFSFTGHRAANAAWPQSVLPHTRGVASLVSHFPSHAASSTMNLAFLGRHSAPNAHHLTSHAGQNSGFFRAVHNTVDSVQDYVTGRSTVPYRGF